MKDFVPAARTADLDKKAINNPGGPGTGGATGHLDDLYGKPTGNESKISVVLDTGLGGGEGPKPEAAAVPPAAAPAQPVRSPAAAPAAGEPVSPVTPPVATPAPAAATAPVAPPVTPAPVTPPATP